MGSEDLGIPQGEGDYRSGFFLADLSRIPVFPLDKFRRVTHGLNADGSVASIVECSVATAQWESFERWERWALRLHYQAQIKRSSVDLLSWVYYYTGIPSEDFLYLQGLRDVSKGLYFLGSTFFEAHSNLPYGNWSEFWPTGKMDEVISGWEQDAL